MSLLMDALKKAEEAKRQSGETGPSGSAPTPLPELRLEPVIEPVKIPDTTPHTSTLPNLSQHLDSVDAELAALPTTAPPARKKQAEPKPKPVDAGTDAKEIAEREAVRNVFDAKQSPKSRTPRNLLLGAAGLAIIGIGGYFWWQLQAVSVSSMARPSAATPPVIAKTPPPPSPAPPVVAATLPKSEAASPVPLSGLPDPMKAQTQASGDQAEKPARPRAAPPPYATDSDGPIRLSSNRLKPDSTLTRAYEALLADNLNDARRDYEQVLRNDPKSTDALLGLATIASRQGEADKAADLYLRVLEADPKDVNAKAGLINLRGQSDPTLSESRLKSLLASQPESATLNFALGNLQARQARWSDAQQAYFRAYTTEPENADYLFNLAVSLDHLRQNKLAVQYYEMALNAAGNRTVAFDKSQVKNRLLELQP